MNDLRLPAAHHYRAPSLDNFIITFDTQKITQSFDKIQKQKNQDSLNAACNAAPSAHISCYAYASIHFPLKIKNSCLLP